MAALRYLMGLKRNAVHCQRRGLASEAGAKDVGGDVPTDKRRRIQDIIRGLTHDARWCDTSQREQQRAEARLICWCTHVGQAYAQRIVWPGDDECGAGDMIADSSQTCS